MAVPKSKVIDITTGEIFYHDESGKSKIKIDGPATRAKSSSSVSPMTRQRVTHDTQQHPANHANAQQPTFGMVSKHGSHLMMQVSNIGVKARLMFLMMHEASYGGRVFITPAIIASEGIASANARRALLSLVEDKFCIKVETDSGYHYQINPKMYAVGDSRAVATATAVWVRETNKQAALKSKKRAEKCKEPVPAAAG